MTLLGNLRKRSMCSVSAAPARGAVWAARFRIALPPATALLLLCAVLFVLTLHELGGYVTGNDPGNWLAAGRAMWESPADANFARPLVPALAQLLAFAVGPGDALCVLAVVSALCIPVALFLVLRTTTPLVLAAVAAFAVGISRPVAEAVAFGGYPQQIAIAGTVLATWLTARMLADPPVRAGWLTAALALVALAHHVFYVLALVACALVVAFRLLEADRDAVLARAQELVMPVAVSLLAFAPTAATMTYRGYEPTPGIASMGLEADLAYTFGDARAFYAAALIFGASGAAVLRLRGSVLQAGAAMIVVAGAVFVVTSEQRLLAMLFVGAALCAAHVAGELVRTAPGPWVRGLVLAALGAGTLAFVPVALETNADVFDYYRILDDDLSATIDAVDHHPAPGTVAVAPGRDGWPIGWWFAGLGEREVVTGSNAGWLAFPGERDDAALVAAMTADGVASGAAAELAGAEGIGFLVADQGTWTGWREWLTEPSPAVELVFANERYVVLRFLGGVAE